MSGIKSMHRWSQEAAPEAPEDLTNKKYVDLVVARKADLESPEFIGRPLVPTAPAGTVDTQAANAAFVQEAIASAISNFSVASHTHNQNEIVGLQGALGAKADLNAPTFTGWPRATTPEAGANDNRLATTAHVKAQGYITSAYTPSPDLYDQSGKVPNTWWVWQVAANAVASSPGAPTPRADAAVGQWVPLNASGAVGTATIPAGGTWAYAFFVKPLTGASGGTLTAIAGIATGGDTANFSGIGGSTSPVGFAWRIA